MSIERSAAASIGIGNEATKQKNMAAKSVMARQQAEEINRKEIIVALALIIMAAAAQASARSSARHGSVWTRIWQ